MKRIILVLVLASIGCATIAAIQREDAADAAIRLAGERGRLIFLDRYIQSVDETTATLALKFATAKRVTSALATKADFRDVFRGMNDDERAIALPILRGLVVEEYKRRRAALTAVEDDMTSGLTD